MQRLLIHAASLRVLFLHRVSKLLTHVRMASAKSARDPNTLSNYDYFRTTHIAANLSIDFAQRRLAGSVTLILETLQESNEVILDTSHLDLSDIKVDGAPTKWTLEPRKEPYGSALKVHVGDTSVGKHVTLLVSLLDVLAILQGAPSDGLIGQPCYDGEMHCAAMDGAGTNLKQEASLHVYRLEPLS